MNISDLIILLVAIGIVAFGITYNVVKKRRNKKAGITGCAGCSGCSTQSSDCCGGPK